MVASRKRLCLLLRLGRVRGGTAAFGRKAKVCFPPHPGLRRKQVECPQGGSTRPATRDQRMGGVEVTYAYGLGLGAALPLAGGINPMRGQVGQAGSA